MIKKDYGKAEQKRLRNRCAWCDKIMRDDDQACAVEAVFRDGVDMEDKEGTFIPLYLAAIEKTIPAFITPALSDINIDKGTDILFMNCSLECAESLKQALAEDMKSFEDLIAKVRNN